MTRLLLDTHVLLWALRDDEALGAHTRALLLGASAVHASVASLWELAIKHSIGKFPDPTPVLVAVDEAGFHLLPVHAAHALAVKDSPLHHRDPFDRLLLAQSHVEGCTLLTADDQILQVGLRQVVDARD